MTGPGFEVIPGVDAWALPCNLEAEQALLGAMLVNNGVAGAIETLRPEHFHDHLHARMFDAIRKVIDRGGLANPVTLKTYFREDKELRDLDGDYLARLASGAVTIVGAPDYAAAIIDAAQRRQLIRIAQEALTAARNPDVDDTAADQIARVQGALDGLEAGLDDGPQPFEVVVADVVAAAEEAHANEGRLIGVPTGLSELDGTLGGLHPGELIIVAARPGMGKSAFGGHVALHAAGAGIPVAFFSLEMPRRELGQRTLSPQSGLPYEDMRRGSFDKIALDRLKEAAGRMFSLPLYIDAKTWLTMRDIKARARQVRHKHGALGLIVVDYLQYIKVENRYRGNKVAEITEVSAGLKAMAKDLAVPVVCLSQLSRKPEDRDDKRPWLGDLRESGSIEQDADTVLFLYREEYYLDRAKPRDHAPAADTERWAARLADVKDKAEIIIAKNRHGRTRTVHVHADMATATFR